MPDLQRRRREGAEIIILGGPPKPMDRYISRPPADPYLDDSPRTEIARELAKQRKS